MFKQPSDYSERFLHPSPSHDRMNCAQSACAARIQYSMVSRILCQSPPARIYARHVVGLWQQFVCFLPFCINDNDTPPFCASRSSAIHHRKSKHSAFISSLEQSSDFDVCHRAARRRISRGLIAMARLRTMRPPHADS